MSPPTYPIANMRTGQTVASAARVADTFWTRFVGLMGASELPAGHGLLIVPCNSVHCFGMKIAIDVVFLDRSGLVLKLYPAMRPWRISSIVKQAHAVLELPVGAIAAASVQVGDSLDLGALGARFTRPAKG